MKDAIPASRRSFARTTKNQANPFPPGHAGKHFSSPDASQKPIFQTPMLGWEKYDDPTFSGRELLGFQPLLRSEIPKIGLGRVCLGRYSTASFVKAFVLMRVMERGIFCVQGVCE